jgi:hypothetical protein
MKKWPIRAALALISFPIAYFATVYATTFTGAPLGNGKYEGTPLTPVVVFTIFPLTLIVVNVAGNLFVNRHSHPKVPK